MMYVMEALAIMSQPGFTQYTINIYFVAQYVQIMILLNIFYLQPPQKLVIISMSSNANLSLVLFYLIHSQLQLICHWYGWHNGPW